MTTRSQSKWWAYIYTFDRGGTAQVIQIGSGLSGGDIYSFNAHKGISSEGGLTLTLVPHRIIDYITHIRPNSTVEFWADNGDGTPPTPGFYFVNRVSQTRKSSQDGKVANKIHIECADWQKLWRNLATYYMASLSSVRLAVQKAYTLQALARSSVGFWSIGNLSTKRNSFFTPTEYFLALSSAFFTGVPDTPRPVKDFVTGVVPSFGSFFPDKPNPRLRLGVDMVIPDSSGKGFLHPLEVVDFGRMMTHPSSFYYAKPIGNLAGSVGRYEDLWSMVRAQSLPFLNELFIDTRPHSESPRGFYDSVLDEVGEFNIQAGLKESVSQDPDLLKSQGISPNPLPYFGSRVKNKGVEWSPTVVLRKRPYHARDLVDRNAFPIHHEMSIGDLNSADLGVSDHDVKNFFTVQPRYGGTNRDQVMTLGKFDSAIFNPDSIALHGLRTLLPATDFPIFVEGSTSSTKKGVAASIQVLRRQAITLAQWYVRNEELLNGTLNSARLRFDIRVGRPLKLIDDRQSPGEPFLFYIETVQSQGQADAGASTALGVVRGQSYKQAGKKDPDIRDSDEPSDLFAPTGTGLPGEGTSKLQFIRHNQRLPLHNPIR